MRGNRGRPLSWLPQARSGPSGREDGLHGPQGHPRRRRDASGERSLWRDAPGRCALRDFVPRVLQASCGDSPDTETGRSEGSRKSVPALKSSRFAANFALARPNLIYLNHFRYCRTNYSPIQSTLPRPKQLHLRNSKPLRAGRTWFFLWGRLPVQ